MGLTIEYHNHSTDCSIFGSIVFDDCYVSVYDGNIKNNIFFKGGTILVDPRVYEISNTGSYNNTIIHECVHWFLHKKGFELQRLYNKNANNIQCSKENKSTKIDEKISFIEWQANAITPRILFPSLMLNKAMIKIGYNLNCKKYRSYLVDSVNDIITKLANNFNISKQSAKIRLIECGVMAANSAFVYIDGHYIKLYSVKAGSLKDFETISISNLKLYSICNRNSTIKKLISSGRIKYTNSLLCVNGSKYL